MVEAATTSLEGKSGSGAGLKLGMLLAFATATSAFNILDRSVLNILAEPIRVSLRLNDTQLGLLAVAFALFYSVVGVPIARYVDRPRTDRSLVVAVCMTLWSAMTVLSGAVTTFVQLLLTRVLVAVGESGSGPALLTLIHQVAPERMRGKAFGVFGLGPPLGILLGLMVGGYLVEIVGWRMTFVIVGAPGLLMALAFKMAIRDPRLSLSAVEPGHAHVGIRQTVRVMVRSKALLLVTAAAATGGLIILGFPSWTAVYLIRVLHLEPGHAGLILGTILGLGGAAGTLVGGMLSDRMEMRGAGRSLIVPAGGLVLGIPAALLAFASDDWRLFTFFYGIAAFGAAFYMGPLVTMLNVLSPPGCRATVTVLVFTAANLVGGGLGPFLMGVASDFLAPSHGTLALRWVMMGASTAAIVPAVLYLQASYAAGREMRSLGRVAI